MAFTIEPFQDSDFSALVPQIFASFGTSHEFVNTLYPNHQTPEGQRKIAARLLSSVKAAPNMHWVKAIDAITKEALGVAAWTCIDTEKPAEKDLDGPPGTWPDELGKEYCQAMHRALLVDRRKHIRENALPIVVLNFMSVFTEYQQKGVGTMLLGRAVHMADELNATVIVESTPVARRLYEKRGFVLQREYLLDAGEKFVARPRDQVLFMVRPRPCSDSS